MVADNKRADCLNVEQVNAIISQHADAILSMFKPGMKITVVIRNPAILDGSQDFVLTNDDVGGAIKALQVRLLDQVKEATKEMAG